MIKRDASFYDLLAYGLGTLDFQEFVDRFKTKYNQPQTDGFEWDTDIQIDFTYAQLQAELGIATLPTYVDIDSPAPYKSQEEFKIGTNKIPRFKHGFAINEKIIREQMIMLQRFGEAAITPATRTVLLNLLFDSTDKLLAGNQNAMTYQRQQVVSTGQYSITTENNPQGIAGLVFDFNIPSSNKVTLATTARWWTAPEHTIANQGADSDPLQNLKDWRKAADKAGFPAGSFEISKDLFDDLLTHTAVLKKVGFALYPNSSSADNAIAYAQNLADDVMVAAIQRIIGCPIVPRDSKACVEKYDKATKKVLKTTIDGFNTKNVSYVPNGPLGTIKAVQPIAVPDPASRIAYFDGGRTVIKQTFDTSTNTQYISSECTALVVPSVSQYMRIHTVTA